MVLPVTSPLVTAPEPNAEENDSVAIVVSEETGVISLVMDGAVERDIAPDQLRTRLAGLILRRRTIERPRETGYSSMS